MPKSFIKPGKPISTGKTTIKASPAVKTTPPDPAKITSRGRTALIRQYIGEGYEDNEVVVTVRAAGYPATWPRDVKFVRSHPLQRQSTT